VREWGGAGWRGGESKSGAGIKEGMQNPVASMDFANGQARRTSTEQTVQEPAETLRTHRSHGTLLTSSTSTTTRSSRNPWWLERVKLPGLATSQEPLSLWLCICTGGMCGAGGGGVVRLLQGAGVMVAWRAGWPREVEELLVGLI
jgi:hypothetical protein